LKITKIRTTRLYDQSSAPFQDSTMARALNGIAWMFVELETNAGITGIAYSEGAGPVRAFIHEQLSDLVVGADPFETEPQSHYAYCDGMPMAACVINP